MKVFMRVFDLVVKKYSINMLIVDMDIAQLMTRA